MAGSRTAEASPWTATRQCAAACGVETARVGHCCRHEPAADRRTVLQPPLRRDVRLPPDVRWTPVGGPAMVDRDAVIAACEASSAELASTTTTFRSFRSIIGTYAVVVDAVAEYRRTRRQLHRLLLRP